MFPAPPGGGPIRNRIHARTHRSYWLFYAVRQWLRRHVTPAGALFFWAMLAAGAFTDVDATLAHYVFGLLLCLLAASLMSVRKPRGVLAIDRVVPPRASVGSPIQYRVELRNLGDSWLRGLEFWEGLPDPRPSLAEFVSLEEPVEAGRNWFDRRYRFYRWTWLCQRNTRARIPPARMPDIPPRARADVALEMTPLRRGRLVLSGAEVARPDAFGLFRRLAVVRERADSILVLPKRFRLPPIPLPGQSQRLHSGGVAMAGSVGNSEEFVSVREYQPGDPLRRIHWTGWARTQRPIVKEFQEEFFVRHALVLDTFAGGPQARAFEDAVSLAASFASSVDRRDSLLDLMFVGDRAYVFTAGRGLAHSEQMLEVLAGVELNPSGDPANIERLVLRHIDRLSGCILILLSWDPARQGLWKRLASRRLPTLTFIISDSARPEDLPGAIHWLTPGRIEESLARLRV